MESYLILKSRLGNITSRFRKNKLPTEEEIEALTDSEKELAAKSLDTVITDLRRQYESAKEGKPEEDKVVSALLNSRLNPVSLQEIDKRIKRLEEINSKYFATTDPLFGREIRGIKYDIPIEGKTNREWTTETIRTLYNQLGKSPSEDLLLALYYFINEKTGGQFTRGQGRWITTLGREISAQNEEPLKEIFKLGIDPSNKNIEGEDRKLFNYFTDKYKYTSSGIQSIPTTEEGKERKRRVITGGKATDETYTDTKRRTTTTGELMMGETKSVKLEVADNIDTRLQNINLSNFRELITNLNRTKSGEGIIASVEGPSIDILYEVINTTGISNLVREVQLSRKGESATKKRKRYISDWAINYINKERESGDANIGGVDLESKEALTPLFAKRVKDRSSDEKQRLLDYQNDRDKAIRYLKGQVEKDNDTFVNSYKTYVRESKRFGDAIEESFDKKQFDNMSIEERKQALETLVDDLNLSTISDVDVQYYVKPEFSDLYSVFGTRDIQSRFRRSILLVLADAFFDTEQETYTNTTNKLITVSGSFTDYIPTGQIFSDTDKDTFIDSMRALITIFRRLMSREEVSKYNLAFQLFADDFEQKLEEVRQKVIDDPLSPVDSEDGEYEINEGTVEELDEYKEEIMSAVNPQLAELEEILQEMLIDSGNAMVSKLKLNIQDIAEDTTGKYKKSGLRVKGKPAGIREYLITKGYLKMPRPPFKIERDGKTYVIDDEDKGVNDMDKEIKYYEQTDMSGEKFVDKNPDRAFKTTIRRLNLGE